MKRVFHKKKYPVNLTADRGKNLYIIMKSKFLTYK